MELSKMKEWIEGLVLTTMDNVVPAVAILVIGLLVIRIVMTLVNKLLENTKLEKAPFWVS